MATFDDAALRAQVVADYDSLTRCITDAGQIHRVFDMVIATAISAVRDSMKAFNAGNHIAQLPAEILVAFCRFLSFSDRISVSHVCSAWRTTSISRPEVWSTISMDYDIDSLELLQIALGRAGASLLDLEVSSTGDREPEEVDAVLEPYIAQLQRVSWSHDEQSALWTHPAPRLEHLTLYHGHDLTPQFLGGESGVLRSLRIGPCAIPRACPALSTVVELCIRDMNLSPDPSSFYQLFRLLPLLQTLSLLGLRSHFSNYLPPGPAPASLRKLTLETRDSYYDLMKHYTAWDARRFHAVSLAMGYVPKLNLRPLLEDATVLWLNFTGFTEGAQLLSYHPNSISRSVTLPGFFGGHWPFGKRLFAVRDALQNVHTVKLSHVALEEFLPALTALCALKHLVVHISSTRRIVSRTPADADAPSDDDTYDLDWAPLSHLPRLPRLDSLTLQVCRMGFREPPVSLADAEALLDVLASTDTRSLPHIIIDGFKEAPVDLRGLQLTFNTTADFPELIFRMPRAHTHFDFWF